jgi:hypothetical protein
MLGGVEVPGYRPNVHDYLTGLAEETGGTIQIFDQK